MDTPDRWIVITLVDNDGVETDKVLAGWYGGYLGSDCWRINSGIEKVEEEDTYFLFHGYSGSVYKCYKHLYGTTGLTASILSNIPEEHILSIDKYRTDYE